MRDTLTNILTGERPIVLRLQLYTVVHSMLSLQIYIVLCRRQELSFRKYLLEKCFEGVGEVFLTYQCMKDQVIPVVTECRQSCPCGTSVAIFETTYMRRLLYPRQPTRDIWRHEVPNYRMTSVFYVCDVSLCYSDSKFQTSIAPLFWIKISSVGMRFLS